MIGSFISIYNELNNDAESVPNWLLFSTGLIHRRQNNTFGEQTYSSKTNLVSVCLGGLKDHTSERGRETRKREIIIIFIAGLTIQILSSWLWFAFFQDRNCWVILFDNYHTESCYRGYHIEWAMVVIVLCFLKDQHGF